MSFSVGSLVRARGRDWVVLPESEDDLLILRPLGGTDLEVTGLLTELEQVEPSIFALPTIKDLGDIRSAEMLIHALRLGFRSSAGPFRSFGRLGFTPRPYQFVPLMMALKLDTVRILIADDVGVGKTAEALMIAAELLAQGEASRLAILCPPHLAVQWQMEMASKFGLEAELVLASTAATLERNCRTGETLFEHFPITVVSTEFIKAERRRSEFLRTAPELIIVDEAHSASADIVTRSSRHQRYELVKALASDHERHLILVTATPHSGNEGAFRSLLSLLNTDFASLPDDLSGDQNRRLREQVARHLVQRRRGDITNFLGDTVFPERLSREVPYELSPQYKALFNRVLEYTAKRTNEQSGDSRSQRIRWWSALALFRALASSPAAAAEILRKRSETSSAVDAEDVDRIGRQRVLDLFDDEEASGSDESLGVNEDIPDLPSSLASENSDRRLLQEFARIAQACQGDQDSKLLSLVAEVKDLLHDGFHPIVFCRFIATANYVASELKTRIKGIEVAAVTGDVPSAHRQELVQILGEKKLRVLVATDCLSEGINLQDNFNAIIHYDLSWNPTRHEQREGRVDRFGQKSKVVRSITCYGRDNRIDSLVLDVLLRKHQLIRNSLGISIPVPGDPNMVVESLIRGVLSRGERLGQGTQLSLEGLGPKERELAVAWESSAERERRIRSIFAQNALSPDVVARELEAVEETIGTVDDLRSFVKDAVRASGGFTSGDELLKLTLKDTPKAIRELARNKDEMILRFDGPAQQVTEREASRIDPFVAGLAAWVVDTALDHSGPAARAGVRRTNSVTTVTTVVIARLRFELRTSKAQLLAEDVLVAGFTGMNGDINWLDPGKVIELLDVPPTGNVSQFQAEEFLEDILTQYENWRPGLERLAHRRGDQLRESHSRVRDAAKSRGATEVKVLLPLDVVGIYVLLPEARI